MKISSLALVLASVVGIASAKAQTYTITDLGTLSGGNHSQAFDINNSNQVVGFSYVSDGSQHAFIYSTNSMHDLGVLDGGGMWAYGLNDNGQAVGISFTGSIDNAISYASGSPAYIGTLGGSQGQAYGINDSGQITGTSTTSAGVYHAFLYETNTMFDIGTLGGYSEATAINSSGQIAGFSDLYSDVGTGELHAFLYSSNSMVDIGTLGGSSSQAFAINDSGQVTGLSATTSGVTFGSDGPSHAFLYSNGSMQDLGSLGGVSSGRGINNIGQVVGYYVLSDSSTHAFLYSNGSMQDLNSLLVTNGGWVLQGASGINDAGYISGTGINPSGQVHAFLLTPVEVAPTITRQPASQTAGIGSTVTFQVRATGVGLLTYQWEFGTNIITGATSSTLSLTNVQTNAIGSYTAVVSNPYGSTTSSTVTLNVLPTLNIYIIPAVALNGSIGTTYELDYVNAMGPTNAWVSLADIMVTNSPQYYYDLSATNQPTRFYRLVQVP